ncbi:MAG: MbnP family copper-binding protein [Cyanobacteria bacterium J06623_7]
MLNKKYLLLASAMVLGWHGTTQAQSDTREVTIDFAAYVGETEFACGESYDEVGSAASTITPTDFRFYVSDVALIDEDGNAVPVELEQDGKWQYQNTALLDFEDGTNTCDNGTADINTAVVGTVPEGDYRDLQFTLGVPQELNHDDAAIAPSPLNLTSMWWNWQGGYKFLRADIETDSAIASVEPTSSSQDRALTNGHGNHSGHGHGTETSHQTSGQASIFKQEGSQHGQTSGTHSSSGHGSHHSGGQDNGHSGGGHGGNAGSNSYMIHLGSTGCSDSAQSSLFKCKNPNRAQIVLEDFDPDNDVAIADLGELLAQSDLTTNDANTPNGCMSSPEDADCLPIMQNLSLSPAATGESAQYFFFVE